jgi:hypothetical protein
MALFRAIFFAPFAFLFDNIYKYFTETPWNRTFETK